jgi:hypothetical protein
VLQEDQMRTRFAGALLVISGVLAAAPLFAHHSFAAEFDSDKEVTLSGTVTKVEWMNPHARFYIEAKDDSGKIVNWEFELGSPNALLRKGWTRNSLKVGDAVSVDAYLAKDGSHLANAKTINLADGRKVFSDSAAPDAPAK